MKILMISILAALSVNAYAEDNYSRKASNEASSAKISSIGAGGAVQVSQLHNQAQTEIQVLLVKQLDEILKKSENAGAPISPNDILKILDTSQRLQAISQDVSATSQGVTAISQDVSATSQGVTAISQDVSAASQGVTALSKSLNEFRYLMYGILAIGIIMIVQLSLIFIVVRKQKN